MDDLLRLLQERLPPNQNEPRAVKWLNGLMPTFVTLFALGSQITFAVIPTIINDEDIPSQWGAEKVRAFVSIAWLFFTLGLGLSCAIALSQVYAPEYVASKLREGGTYEKLVNGLCGALQVCVAVAFLFLSLVVVAYTPAVGWLIVLVSSISILVAVGTLIIDLFL